MRRTLLFLCCFSLVLFSWAPLFGAKTSFSSSVDPEFDAAYRAMQEALKNQEISKEVVFWLASGGGTVMISRYLYLGYKSGAFPLDLPESFLSWAQWQRQAGQFLRRNTRALERSWQALSARTHFFFLEARHLPAILAYRRQWAQLQQETVWPVPRILEYKSRQVSILKRKQERAVLQRANWAVKKWLAKNKMMWLKKNPRLENLGVYDVLFSNVSKEEARAMADFVWQEEIEYGTPKKIYQKIKSLYRDTDPLRALEIMEKKGDLIGLVGAGPIEAKWHDALKAKTISKTKVLVPLALVAALLHFSQKQSQEAVLAQRIAQNPSLLLYLNEQEAAVVEESDVLKTAFYQMVDLVRIYHSLPLQEQQFVASVACREQQQQYKEMQQQVVQRLQLVLPR